MILRDGGPNPAVGGRLLKQLWRTVMVVALASLCPGVVLGQTIIGTVTERDTGHPLAGAGVRLVGPLGITQAAALSDSTGHYRLSAPGTGPYAVVANRFGFVSSQSPLMQLDEVDGVSTVHLELAVSPIEVEGVIAVGQRRLEQRLRESIGLSPDRLLTPPILREERDRRAPKARTVRQAIHDLRLPALVTTQGYEGPCFAFYGRGCLPVFLDGVAIPRDMVDQISLDLVEAIVVIREGESVLFDLNPAVLLFTRPWLR